MFWHFVLMRTKLSILKRSFQYAKYKCHLWEDPPYDVFGLLTETFDLRPSSRWFNACWMNLPSKSMNTTSTLLLFHQAYRDIVMQTSWPVPAFVSAFLDQAFVPFLVTWVPEWPLFRAASISMTFCRPSVWLLLQALLCSLVLWCHLLSGRKVTDPFKLILLL